MPLRSDADIVLAKASTVRKCLATIRRLKAPDAPQLEGWIVQDVVVLNLQRAAQACLDLANHLITANSWELPRSARHAVEILHEAGVISRDQARIMGSVMGFRNVAVHDYQALQIAVVRAILEKHLDELLAFARLGVAEAAGR